MITQQDLDFSTGEHAAASTSARNSNAVREISAAILATRPLPVLARATDPATSHKAALAITRNGSRQSQADRVLDLVRRHPGSTYTELARIDREECGRAGDPSLRPLEPVQVMRRLADLAPRDIAGAPCTWALVERGPERRCVIERREMTTWLPRPRAASW